MLPKTPAVPLPTHVMRQTHLLPVDEMSSHDEYAGMMNAWPALWR